MKFFVLFLLCFAWVASSTHAVHEHTWLPSHSPVEADLTKVVFGAGTFVALHYEPSGQMPSVIVRSTDGISWETVALPEGDWPGGHLVLRDMAFGGGKFVAVGSHYSRSGPHAAQVLVSENGETWSIVQDFPEPGYAPTSVEYVQGRFLMSSEDSQSYFSSEDGVLWTHAFTAPGGVPVEFENGFFLKVGQVLRHGAWTEEGGFEWGGGTRMHGSIADVAVGADRVVAAVLGSGVDNAGSHLAISGDSAMWMLFDQPSPVDFDQVTHLGGAFWATRRDNEAGSHLMSSRDGVRWSNRSHGIGDNVLHSMVEGQELLVAVGDGGVILHRSANLPPAIVSEPPAEVSLSAGHPLLLAVEADIGEGTSVTWRKDGQTIAGKTGLTLEIPAVAPDDAGTYTAFLSNDHGFVESAASTVTVGPATSTPIPWIEAAELEGDLSRLAAGNGHLLALAHHGDFHESLRTESHELTLPAAWSGNGYHWREAAFTRGRHWDSGQQWISAGFANGHFWMGRHQHLALSEDGIAWREVPIDTSMHVMLVGEHQGKFFATTEASSVWESEDGKEWSLSARFPVPWAGDYISDGEDLLVASHAGIVRWDGTSSERAGEYRGYGAQPRLARNGETTFFLSRDVDPTYALSGDLKSWTTLEDTLVGARDLLAHRGNFMAIGPENFQTSSDGIWWADRSHSLDTITLSAIAAVGEQLFAVGDEGKVLRRPAALEPAFYQHPQGIGAIRGQPVRLTARATGSESITYQWYRDGVAIQGATDSVLEFAEISRMDAGEYHVVATNTTGSVASEPATVTVVLRTAEPVPWQKIGELPLGFDFSGPDGSVVSRGQRIVAVDGQEKVVAVSEDGREWVRTGVSGASGRAERTFADRVFYVGGKFFAAGKTWVAVSDEGAAWRILDLEGDVRDVAFGNGIFVIVTGRRTPGPSFWSADLVHWSQLPTMGIDRVRFGNGRFVGVGVQGGVAVSNNGVFWSEHFPAEMSPWTFDPMRTMAFGNGVFLVRGKKDGVPYFFASPDGEHWDAVEATDPFHSLTFQGNDFWKTTGDPASLFASTSGMRWVNRQVNLPSDHPARIAAADGVDIIALAGHEVYRRSALLEPVFYPNPPDYVVYPGNDLMLDRPAAHGNEATYNWFKDGTPLGPFHGEWSRQIFDAGPDDGGVYRVTARNPSGGDAIDFLVHFLSGFEDWADVYHRDGQPREKTADPDGLGIPNLLRYALHLDPENPDRSKLPRTEILETNGEEHLALRFQLLDGVEDYAWWLEASNDLRNWDNIQWGYVERDDQAGRVREMLVRDPVPMAHDDSRFLRLRIQKPETD